MHLRERRTMPAQPLLRAAGPCRVLSDADVVALTAGSVDMLDAIERDRGTITTIYPHEGGATTVPPCEGMAVTTMPSEGLPKSEDTGTTRLSGSDPRARPLSALLSQVARFTVSRADAVHSSLNEHANPGCPVSPLPSLTSAFSRRKAIFGAVVLAATPAVSLPALAVPAAIDAEIVDLADRIEQLCIECDRLTEQRATIEDRTMTEGPRRPEPPPKPPSRTNIVHRDTVTERVMVVSFQLDPDPAETEWKRARDAAEKAFDRNRAAMEESLGLPEVCGRLDRNWMRLQQCAADLAEMEPRTSAGLAAKAAAVMSIDTIGGVDDWGVDLALALAADAVRLCGTGGARV